MNSIAVMKLLPATKSELTTYAGKVKDELMNGTYNPLEFAGMLKAMEELTKMLRQDADIKVLIEDEADKYPEKTIDLGNFTITKSWRKSYDYTGCDEYLDTLEQEVEKLKKVIDARKRTILGGVNPETGEIFPEPVVSNQSIISISIKK